MAGRRRQATRDTAVALTETNTGEKAFAVPVHSPCTDNRVSTRFRAAASDRGRSGCGDGSGSGDGCRSPKMVPATTAGSAPWPSRRTADGWRRAARMETACSDSACPPSDSEELLIDEFPVRVICPEFFHSLLSPAA